MYLEGNTPKFVNAPFKELDPGQMAVWVLNFTMPPTALTVYITAWSGNPGQGEATYQGYKGPYTIAVTGVEWMDVGKPQWLRDALDSGWLNLEAGEWGSIGPLKFPPFSFTPGHWIEKAIDFVLNIFNSFMNTMKGAWDQQWQQNEGFAGMIRSLTEDLSDVRNLFSDIGAFFDQIFDRVVKELVQVEPFKTIIGLYNTLAEFLPDDWAELKNFFLNPVEYWFDKLEGWLNEEVSE